MNRKFAPARELLVAFNGCFEKRVDGPLESGMHMARGKRWSIVWSFKSLFTLGISFVVQLRTQMSAAAMKTSQTTAESMPR